MPEDVYLRFEGLKVKGDCLDSLHPGEFGKFPKGSVQNQPAELKNDGWIAIKGFEFGFGWDGGAAQGEADGLSDQEKKVMKDSGTPPQKIQELDAKRRADNKKKTGSKDKAGKSGEKESAFKPKPFTFSKNSDRVSSALMAKLQGLEDREIPKVVVEMCRPSVKDSSLKVPFFRLILEDVTIVKCGLEAGGDPNPTERVTLELRKATIWTLWTSNSTGPEEDDIKEGDMQWAGWDFKKEKLRKGSADRDLPEED